MVPGESVAVDVANNDPWTFFKSGYDRFYPNLEHLAYDNLIEKETLGAQFYFVFAYQKGKFEDLAEKAIHALVKNTPERYFSLLLFLYNDFEHLAEQAVESLLSKDRGSFFSIYNSLSKYDISEYEGIIDIMEKYVPSVEKTAKSPSYIGKEKTDSGYVWHYSDAHIKKRWKNKQDKIERLEKNIRKVRDAYQKDLASDNDRSRAIACVIGVIDDTAMRVGNIESMNEVKTYGATTLKVKHISFDKGQARFRFVGKGGVKQDVTVDNTNINKVLKDLVKGKKKEDFIFTSNGKRINDRAINRYLNKFDISAKDIRGFHSNRLMKDALKNKDFKDALEEVAKIVGHEPSTLKNQYLLPSLVQKYEKKASLNIMAYEQVEQSDIGGPELKSTDFSLELGSMPVQKPIDIHRNVSNIRSRAKITPTIATAWKILAPFLPLGAELSSGFRSDQDQAKTIRNIWYGKWNGYFAKNFPQYGTSIDKMQEFMTEIYNNMPDTERPPGGPDKVYVSAPGDSLHQSGKAMDIHNIRDLGGVERTIRWVNRHMGDFVDFVPLREKDQNNIHVSIKKVVYPGPVNMYKFLQEWYHGTKNKNLYVSQSHKPLLSKRAELSTEEIQWLNAVKSKVFDIRPQYSRVSDVKGIRPRVKVNTLVADAWKSLYPFLPKGSVMTSGIRTPEDQKRIIRNYWKKATGSQIPDDFTRDDRGWARAASILTKQYGYIVGPPFTNNNYAHLKGNAFDISGADLDAISNAVNFVSRSDIPVKFRKPLIERNNNAVHVGVESAVYDGQAVAQALKRSEYRFAAMRVREDYDDDLVDVYEDLMNSGAPDEVLEVFKNLQADCYEWNGSEKYAGKVIYPFDLPEEAHNAAMRLPGAFKKQVDKNLVAGEIPLAENISLMWIYVNKRHIPIGRRQLGYSAAARVSYYRDKSNPEYITWFEFDSDDPYEVVDKLGVFLSSPKVREDIIESIDKELHGNVVGLVPSDTEFVYQDKPADVITFDKKSFLSKRAYSIGPVAPMRFIDLDVHNGFPRALLMRYSKDAVKKIKDKYGVSSTIYESGGAGLHIEFMLPKPININKLRKELKKLCDDLNEKYKEFDTGVIKGIRTDVTTLKHNGNIRVPYSLHEKYGGVKKPVQNKKISCRYDSMVVEAKDKPKAGVFIRLPKDVAKQFPSLGEHDDSVPHITTLFIGHVPEKHEILLEEVVRRVAMEYDPFEVELDDKVSYFPVSKHSDGCRVAKMAVISKGLRKLHNDLKKALLSAGVQIDDHFPRYNGHVTLEYVEPPKKKYEGAMPIGRWYVDKIEIWNGDKKTKIPIGRTRKILSKRDPLKEYHAKRDFDETSEPKGKVEKEKNQNRFVIQSHRALKAGHHWDLRLSHKGILQSWAVPKGKFPVKDERILAIKTEDHPWDYIKFEGNIKEGYGKGKVKIHDSGTYEEIERKPNTIRFRLHGKKEKENYTLHHTKDNKWLLMRGED